MKLNSAPFSLQHAWYAFVKLLDIDNVAAFTCPQCGRYPDNLVMDGVCLSLRKAFLPVSKADFTFGPQLDGR